MNNKMNSDEDQELLDEADRLIGDTTRNASLLFDLYRSSSSDASGEDFQDEIDELIQKPDYDYATEADILGDRVDYQSKNSLFFLAGFYKLMSEKYEIYNLTISRKENDGSEIVDLNAVDVFLRGLKLENFTFKDKVLQWDNLSADGKQSKGTLNFTHFFENTEGQSIGEKDYCGPLCEGTILFSNDPDAKKVKGKIGVFSANAVRGDYKATDPLFYWAGSYNVYLDNNSNKEAAILTIERTNDVSNAIQLNGEPINNPVYNNGTLSWKGKQAKNNSIVRITLTQSPNRKKLLAGRLRLKGAANMADVVGIQTSLAPPLASPTEAPIITTTNLPPGKKDENYSVPLESVGGTPPYTWELKNPKNKWPEERSGEEKIYAVLPKSLDVSEGGYISGKPEEPGTWGVDARVKDSKGKMSLEKNIFLKIDDKAASSSVSNEVRPWVAPLITAILAYIGIIIGAKLKSIYDEKMRKKTEDAKKATESQRPEIADFSSASTAEERAEIIRKEGEYRRRAITEIRERTFRINDELNKQKEAVNKEILRLNSQLADAVDDVKNELDRQILEKVLESREIEERQNEAIRELPPEEREDAGVEDAPDVEVMD